MKLPGLTTVLGQLPRMRQRTRAVAAARGETPGHDLSFATLLRILFEWRWLILSLIAVGLAGATIITLLTTPLFRSQATLEANPPSVEIMGEKTGAQGADAGQLDLHLNSGRAARQPQPCAARGAGS